MSQDSDPVVVGYKYYLGVHAVLCHGPVDAVTQLIVGERSAWSGSVTANGSISVNQPELFGGESREGGVAGTIDIMMGGPTQPVNAYLQGFRGANTPAYRGVLSAVFRRFYWSAMNPYFKSPWWRVRRILEGWSTGEAWYSSKATINTLDMNPAHIIYQCLTDTNWGMGYSSSDIGASFTTAADKLYDEGFGLSMLWSEQTSISDFIGIVLDHINGSLYLDLATGKFELKLIRDDYVVGDLPQLNPSNVLSLDSFQRAAWGDTANQVTVIYTGRNEEDKSITVQDLSSIEAQGGIIPVTREYRGIRNDALATRVAMRDLNTSSSPLAKVTLTCNRVAWNWGIGTAFAFTWPRLGLAGVPMRVVSINKGTLVDGSIQIEAVEDVFGLPTSAYTSQQPSGWVDPINPPSPVAAQRTVEVPYWDLIMNVPEADRANFGPSYGFGQLLAVKPTSDAYGYELHYSPTSGGTYSKTSGRSPFNPSGTLAADISYTNTTVTLNNGIDLDLMQINGYAYIDDEVVQVISFDENTGVVGINRGVLDTVPAKHAAGARFYFASGGFSANDKIERVSGEVVHYKALPQTGYGVLALSGATAIQLTLANRASRPYPPGQLKINGLYYPSATVEGVSVNVSWAHRDRTQQTATLVDYTQGNIGPEVGTTYTVQMVRVSDSAVLASQTGLTGTTATLSPSGDGLVRVKVTSVRDGITSWQSASHEFEYVRSETRLTEDGEDRITEAGETRITE